MLPVILPEAAAMHNQAGNDRGESGLGKDREMGAKGQVQPEADRGVI
jgi:hypothetical protein